MSEPRFIWPTIPDDGWSPARDSGPTLTFYADRAAPVPTSTRDLPRAGPVLVTTPEGEQIPCTYEVDDDGGVTLNIPPPDSPWRSTDTP